MGTPVEAKAQLLAKVLARARERLPAAQSDEVAAFIRHYYERVPADDLVGRDPVDVYGAAVAHWQLARSRQPGMPMLRLFTPSSEQHGWQSSHTVVEIVTDDMPFLVDSVSMELSRHGCGIHRIIHPVFTARRSPGGDLEALSPPAEDGPGAEGRLGAEAGPTGSLDEAFIEVEIDRQTEPARLDRLRDDLRRILADVRAAWSDRAAMTERARQVAADLAGTPPVVEAAEVAEARALLEWLADGNFIFLGYREYDLLEEDGGDVLRSVPGSGLGILRSAGFEPVSRSFAKLPPDIRRRAREPNVLNLTRANARSTVHRARHLDYVGVKWFGPDGRPGGERRFVGLYAASVHQRSPFTIPVLRSKVRALLERSGLGTETHSGKALVEVLETYPFDELVEASPDELYDTAMEIVQLEERQRVRLFARRDRFGRFFSCLVYLPRDRYNTTIRRRMQDILQTAFAGRSVEFSTRVAESVLVRLHFTVYTEAGQVPDYDVAEVQARLAEATRTWADDLHDALIEQCGEEQGVVLYRRYADAFPAGYQAEFTAASAVADIRRLEQLGAGAGLGMSLYRPLEAPAGFVRFKLFRSGGPIPLSDLLPVLENMGARVIDERPYEVLPSGAAAVWIYDFGLSYEQADFDADRVRDIFQETFARVWRGDAENDGLNRLALRANLSWREVVVLRTYCRYLRQTGTTFSQAYMEQTLARHPALARRLVELFHSRLDPALAAPDVAARQADLEDEILRGIDQVASLDDDRILRGFLHLTLATLRTNYYQVTAAGQPKAYVSVKLDPRRVPDLPRPLPRFEIFVYSPRTEGVHLRGGKVARGGIRWSDRREDFRTEVLGLMKAQMVKNAVIVPAGAKGGFVVKQSPAGSDRDALHAEVVDCYRTLIRGMLDLTDNLVGGEVVGPPDVVRHDDDDPYLVVAADKGTATFSDIANGISAEYGYWLGDAFASGGSAGYDHKKMGITARGAWESVKRHFRELGVDTQTTAFSVAGIGDMSGDVFGNGMLQSPQIRLLAAFDHRHVFVDPDPDPAVSLAERRRLFGLPRSSWADYRPELISEGGGVFARSAKSVTLSPQAQRALGVGGATLTPDELVSLVLRAPVDLLWNGGIGTYVKASDETHADVGDKVNDAVRVDADELRCRVVGEGGNLGFTQRARIEYAANGGRIYTDAIDNSAGVDCSDHEVNIKILLDQIVADGDLTGKQRDELMAEMTDEVAELVLRDNYLQTQALSNALAQSAGMVDVHARYLRSLEQAGKLDRRLEFLPGEEQLAERQAAGRGLTAPEFAVVMAYSKITLQEELLASDLPEDPYLAIELEGYFPTPIRQRFARQLRGHRLRREIIATTVANSVTNRAGMSAVFRLTEETGADASDIARAHIAAREIFELAGVWDAVEGLDNRVAADVQTTMLLESRRLAERSSRWLLRTQRRPTDIAAAVARFRPAARVVADRLCDLLVGGDRKRLEAATDRLVAAGVPTPLARRVAGFGPAFSILDIAEVAANADQPVVDVAGVYFALADRLQVDWVRDQVALLPRGDRWQALARSALRDDVYGVHRALTEQVVASSPLELGAEDRVDEWISQHRAHVRHCESLLGDIRSDGHHDLVTISVALREVRNLVESGTARRF